VSDWRCWLSQVHTLVIDFEKTSRRDYNKLPVDFYTYSV